MGAVIKTMLEKQLAFAEKKSLTRWQRYELDSWIHENLEEIDCMGLVDEDLRNAMANKYAREHDIDIDDSSEISPAEQLDHWYEANFPESDSDDDDILDSLFGDQESDLADEMMDDLFQDELDEELSKRSSKEQQEKMKRKLFEDFFRQFDETGQHAASSNKKKRIDSSVFKRLFRQTANALHPDKELDDARRQEKHTLMTSLLEARKNNDLITVLQLHQRFVDAQHSLSNADQRELEVVLINYVHQQQDEAFAIINQSPMHAGVHQRFYVRTKKGVDNKIAKHLKSIDERIRAYKYFSSEVKTLKALKDFLAQRYDQHRFTSYADEFF